MKPAPFDYHAPDSVAEALGLLAQHGEDAKALAGGQSLVPVLNFRLARPAVLVDLNRIASLRGIEAMPDGGVRIGAMARQREAEQSEVVAVCAPLLTEALPHVAHVQIRNRGTIGGSLAHADPAAELPALALALEARLQLRRGDEERWLDASDFFTGLFSTALAPDELLVAVELPALPPRAGCAFEEVARRHGDYALMGIAAIVVLDANGVCTTARIACINAGPGPLRAATAERALLGQRITGEVVRAAADAVDRDIRPTADVHASVDYRRHLARVLTRRAVTRAAARAAGPE
ncbi:MAG: xanthine dehydrogenase family protein subunit M [Gemmatimonadetes bacterium]|nr:xanthine dehydrogenase family protein subunit M [Gemmatimonadota bacterium]